jgi:hypothetical protein
MTLMRRSLLVAALLFASFAAAQEAAPAPPAMPAMPAMPEMPAMPKAQSDAIRFSTAPSSVAAATSASAAFDCMAHDAGGSRSNSIRTNDDRHSWTVSISANGCSADLRAEGVVTFNRNASAVEQISSGGWVEATERNAGNSRRVEIRADGASLKYNYSINGTQHAFDQEAQAWFASFLLGMERQTGFAAEVRIPALLRSGGVSAVLGEIPRMASDYAKARYFILLFDSAKLSGADVRRVLELAGREMHSDFETARVLISVSRRYDLADETARVAYLDAANHIKSDFEHARVLIDLLKREQLSPAVVSAALESTTSIHSDFERARVLISLTQHGLLDATNVAAYVSAASDIKSDFEKARTFIAAIGSAPLNDQIAVRIIEATNSMHSDFEIARVLTSIAAHHKLEGPVREAYVRRAETIKSEYERNRVLAGVVRRGSM